MANVIVTTSFSNVQVSESNANVINVTTTPSNITITSGSTVNQSVIRNALSNTAPITYDTANGVIGFDSTTFTTDITTTANVTAANVTATANVTAAIFKSPGSNTNSIAWNDNLELWELQGNILRVANNSSLTGAPVSSIDPGHAVMIGYDDFGGTPAESHHRAPDFRAWHDRVQRRRRARDVWDDPDCVHVWRAADLLQFSQLDRLDIGHGLCHRADLRCDRQHHAAIRKHERF